MRWALFVVGLPLLVVCLVIATKAPVSAQPNIGAAPASTPLQPIAPVAGGGVLADFYGRRIRASCAPNRSYLPRPPAQDPPSDALA